MLETASPSGTPHGQSWRAGFGVVGFRCHAPPTGVLAPMLCRVPDRRGAAARPVLREPHTAALEGGAPWSHHGAPVNSPLCGHRPAVRPDHTPTEMPTQTSSGTSTVKPCNTPYHATAQPSATR